MLGIASYLHVHATTHGISLLESAVQLRHVLTTSLWLTFCLHALLFCTVLRCTLSAGAKPVAKPPAAAPVQPQKPAKPSRAVQPIASQASQLRTKFGQLTDLLQHTALQRGISLSEVPIPATRKPNDGQNKRVSLEEVRISFRSFTMASSSAVTAGKSAPIRRVSTGAITPAFLKEKDKVDRALLDSLGIAGADAAPDAATSFVVSSPRQKHSSVADLLDETPAVVTRGKGKGRPTGPSFDIKLQDVDLQDMDFQDDHLSAADNKAVQDGKDAAQASGAYLSQGTVSKTAGVGAEATPGATVAAGSRIMGSSVSEALDAVSSEQHDTSFGSPTAVASHTQTVSERDGTATRTSNQSQLQPAAASTDCDGIKSSGVQVEVMVAQDSGVKVKAHNSTGQPDQAPQAGKAKKRYSQRFCCCPCQTKE